MPNRVKLLNAQGAGVTGAAYKIGTGIFPYTIRIRGGITLGGGAAGTKGISVETSEDNVNWARDFGHIGGENFTEVEIGELIDLPDKTIAYISHNALWIRALTGSSMVGLATVELSMSR